MGTARRTVSLKKKTIIIISQNVMIDFCKQSRHKNLALVKIKKTNCVAELTGMLEELIIPTLCRKDHSQWSAFSKYRDQLKWAG